MKPQCQVEISRRENGAALLIAIFALLLISVVAIALIVTSGTDTALARNYRTSTNAYYAALAGVEEARGRLLPTNPNYIPLPGSPMPLTQVIYILNPLGSETVAPQNTSNPATYPDTEYNQEFCVDVSTRVVTTYPSVSPAPSASPSLPGPSFKWVRINPVTEQSLGGTCPGPGVDVNSDGTIDNFTPLFYNPVLSNVFGAPIPGLIENASPPPTAGQVLEITSLAVLPNGGRKMLQYVVRPLVIFPGANLPQFPAALTLDGNAVTFQGPGTVDGTPPGSPNYGFYVNGLDNCVGSSLSVPAIGATNAADKANVISASLPTSNYLGPANGPPPSPPYTAPQSIQDVSAAMNLNWLNPGALDAIVQDITNHADSVISGPATPAMFPSGMSSTHPMTIVVTGDLDLNSWHGIGYGLLVVTGTLKYDPDASWQGVILVIGQGAFVSTKGGVGEIDGAMLIAKTRDASGNLLAALGPSSFSQTGSGGPHSDLGKGIYFNNCLAQSAQGPIAYKVISFKEIPLTN